MALALKGVVGFQFHTPRAKSIDGLSADAKKKWTKSLDRTVFNGSHMAIVVCIIAAWMLYIQRLLSFCLPHFLYFVSGAAAPRAFFFLF